MFGCIECIPDILKWQWNPDITGLEIMASQWTIAGLTGNLTGQTFISLVMLTGHDERKSTYLPNYLPTHPPTHPQISLHSLVLQ